MKSFVEEVNDLIESIDASYALISMWQNSDDWAVRAEVWLKDREFMIVMIDMERRIHHDQTHYTERKPRIIRDTGKLFSEDQDLLDYLRAWEEVLNDQIYEWIYKTSE